MQTPSLSLQQQQQSRHGQLLTASSLLDREREYFNPQLSIPNMLLGSPIDSAEANIIDGAIHVISTECAALANLELLYQRSQVARDGLLRSVSQVTNSVKRGGKLVVCGVGKSGKIGRKVEATMNSMGIHSAFLHPTEALHGDLGMIRPVWLAHY